MSTPNSNESPRKVNPPSGESVSREQYLRHLQRARDTSSFFIFSRNFCKIVPSRLDALFLQDLINLSSMDGVRKQTIDGKEFFLCTTSFLENGGMQWTEKEQRAHFLNLREGGLVETVRVGLPPLRWVHIDLEAVDLCLDAVSTKTSQSSPNGLEQTSPSGPVKNEGTSYLPKEGKKGEPAVPRTPPRQTLSETTKDTLEDLPAYAREFGAELKRILESQKERRVPVSKAKRRSWAEPFRTLVNKLGGDNAAAERVRAVLRWYSTAVDGLEKPTIASAEDFCRERVFAWLQGICDKQDPIVGVVRKVQEPSKIDPSRILTKSKRFNIRRSEMLPTDILVEGEEERLREDQIC
jgi:hypothetical protein